MTRNGKQVLLFVSSLLCCGGAYAIVGDNSGNPYQGIVDRNVFGLKPPPPPPPTEPPLPPAPKVTITGITTILGNKRVLLEVAIPAKGTEPAQKKSYILTEGQRDGDIEVLQIDEKTGDVKLNDFGTVMTLNIEKDGPKLASTPPPAAAGVPGAAGAAAGVNPTLSPAAGGAPGKLNIPTRALRTMPANTGGGMGSAGIPAPSGYPTGVMPGTFGTPVINTTTPANPAPTLTFNPGLPVTQPGAAPAQNPVPMTPEEQAILIEVERERNINNQNYAPLPPTPLTPPGQANTTTPGRTGPGLPGLPPMPPAPR
jgi:hypothetical protein